MKIGMRKPNIKKRISARTTGKIKREIKSTINPLYGKKGMAMINDPKKAVYNKIYNKTTLAIDDLLDTEEDYNSDDLELFKINQKKINNIDNCKNKSHFKQYVLIILGIICLLNSFVIGKLNLITIILGIILIYFGSKKLKDK